MHRVRGDLRGSALIGISVLKTSSNSNLGETVGCPICAEDTKRFEKLVKKEIFKPEPGKKIVLERHRHRYEVNPKFIKTLEDKGLVFSGYYTREDGTNLMEFIELPEHKFFVATQAHPEFKSRLANPSPLFYGFIQACLK